MVVLILSNVATCLVTTLIVTLFFIFKIWKRWKEQFDDDTRKRDIELYHVSNELSPGEREAEADVKE